MPDTPVFFSIVIPLYNKEATIARAIQSVLNQTVQDFEIVIVNDGSTDKGPDIVSAIKDSRIRLIHQENQGVSAARNKGIAEAKYDLIAFLDADDEWHPQFIEEILNLKSKYPMCDVYATNYFYKESDKVLFKTIINGLPANQSDGVIKDILLFAQIRIHCFGHQQFVSINRQ